MNIYLAGPMRGIKNFNFPEFHRAAHALRQHGHEVFSPAERDELAYGAEAIATSGNEKDFADGIGMSVMDLRREVFKADAEWICTFADAIALLPGWQNSKGALAEKALGEALGLEIIYL